jgi:hypothetical protein
MISEINSIEKWLHIFFVRKSEGKRERKDLNVDTRIIVSYRNRVSECGLNLCAKNMECLQAFVKTVLNLLFSKMAVNLLTD